MRWSGVGVVVSAMLWLSAVAHAQITRSAEFVRHVDPASPLALRLEHVGGTLVMRGATDDSSQVRMQLKYDAGSARPVYDVTNTGLEMGMRTREANPVPRRLRARSAMTVILPRNVAMGLDVHVAAVNGDLELGGLRISSARITAGAGKLGINFASPNPGAMASLDIDAGAAFLSLAGIGNAHVSRLHINQGAGTADLDFSGNWTGRIDAQLDVGAGMVTVHVPRDVGVRLEVHKLLTSLDQEGLQKRDDAYYSENFATATRTVSIRVNSALGMIRLRRDDP